jgi:hypothetical protein
VWLRKTGKAGKIQRQQINPSHGHEKYFRAEIEFLTVLRLPYVAVSEVVNITPF